MPVENDKDGRSLKRTIALYNMIPNLIWSILNLVPVSIFCFSFMELKLVYIFLGVSLIPVFLKNAILDKLQLSNTVTLYKKLGVHLLSKITQNGLFINSIIQKKFPGYKVVTPAKSSIFKLINQTYMFEKFHLILFVFFSLVIVYALFAGQILWACLLMLTNIAYNIYPNFLQQYIRVKLTLFNKKIISITPR